MYWDIVAAKPQRNRCLYLTFRDGLAGNVHLPDHLLTGALEPLRDENFFAGVFLDQGTVAWPGEIDLAPDALYRMLQAQLESETALAS